MLSDPKRLHRLAQEWLAEQRQDPDDAPGPDDLDTRIAARQRRLANLLADTDLPYDAVFQATATLRGELQELERLRTAREEWLASSAAQQRRLDSLSALAEDAATRLPDMGLEEQRRVVELLDLEITVTAYDRPPGKAVVPTVRISGVVPTGNTALPGNNGDVVG